MNRIKFKMKKELILLLFLLWAFFTVVSPATADWINLSGAQSAPNIAEIYVEDDHVRLVLEIYVQDIVKFIDLLPDEWLQRAGMDPPPIQERMKRFSTDGFQVILADQKRLIATMKLVEPGLLRRIDRAPVPCTTRQ